MKSFCQTFSKNGFSSTKKAVPPEELEPELFLKEPKSCQIGPKNHGMTKEIKLEVSD